MPVTSATGTITPVVGGEITVATITGGPFDNISVYVEGGATADGLGQILYQLYAVVGTLAPLVALSQIIASSNPSILQWQAPGGGTTSSQFVEAGGTEYILTATAQPTTTLAYANITATIAGVNESDTAPISNTSSSLALLPFSESTTANVAGFSQLMDVGIDLVNLPYSMTVIVYANNGASSVEAPVKQITVSGPDSITSIFRQIILPVASVYRVAVLNNTGNSFSVQISVSTYTSAVGGGGGGGFLTPAVGEVGVSGPTNANFISPVGANGDVLTVVAGSVQFVATTSTYIDNIAALKALPVAAGNAQVLGYYTPADGGGGLFTYEAGSVLPPDNGVVIAPDVGPGNWIRNYDDGPLNALWFGLVADGVTPNDAANNDMINSTAGQNGVGFFYPGGQYVFEDTVGPFPLGCVVSGCGLRSHPGFGSHSVGTTWLFPGQGIAVELGHDPSSTIDNGTVFQDIEILGQNPNGDASFPNINEIGIEILNDVSVVVRNVRLGGFKFQLSFDGCEVCTADGVLFDGVPPGGLGYPSAEMEADNGVNSAFAIRFGSFNSIAGDLNCNSNTVTGAEFNNTGWAVYHAGGVGNAVMNSSAETIAGIAIFNTLGLSTFYQNIIAEGARNTSFLFLATSYGNTFINCSCTQNVPFITMSGPTYGLVIQSCYFRNQSNTFPVIGSSNIQGGMCMGCLPPIGAGTSTVNVIFDSDPLMMVDSGFGTDGATLGAASPFWGIQCQPLSPLDVNGNRFRIRVANTPADSADPQGNTGDICWDANFIYVKTGVGAWKRTALTTF